MSDLADLFPGFESHWIPIEAGKIFARSAGKGPPLVLIHGFPQCHVQWHRIAPRLAEKFHVVIPDLRGYGWSSAPEDEGDHSTYAKRTMAADIITVMDALGHIHFSVVGHDRGGRVAYRLALDLPGRVDKLALLDIAPTYVMWRRIKAAPTPSTEHWLFLSQPSPEPETEILKDTVAWQDAKLAGWSKAKNLKAFDPRALAHYHAFFNDPTRVAACCEDYRAGATQDLAADEADLAAGRRIIAPTLLLWGDAGIPAQGESPLQAWQEFAPQAQGRAVNAGHFLPEENPDETLSALLDWL